VDFVSASDTTDCPSNAQPRQLPEALLLYQRLVKRCVHRKLVSIITLSCVMKAKKTECESSEAGLFAIAGGQARYRTVVMAIVPNKTCFTISLNRNKSQAADCDVQAMPWHRTDNILEVR